MDVGDRLRDEGYRLTPQRQLVWEVLRAAEHHVTAEQVHEEVSRTVPGFNLTSVYRTLALLEELGLVKQVRLGDRGSWELAHPDEEFHLVCRSCRSVSHHRGTLVERMREHLQTSHGFLADHVDLVVHGLCDACAGEAAAR